MELNFEHHLLPNDIIEKIESVSNSECSSKQVADGLKYSSKEIYDNVYKKNIWLQLQSKALRKLLVDGFDSEQIFQQIELQNKSAIEHFNKCISSVDAKYTSSIINDSFVESSDDDDEELKVQTYSKGDLSENKEYIFDDDSDSSVDSFSRLKPSTKKTNKSADNLDLSDNDEDGGFLENMTQLEEDEEIGAKDEEEIDANVRDEKKSKKERSKETRNKKFHSVVDDQFFKLSNLSEFLKIEDIKAENEDVNSEDDDEDIDYFEDMPSDDFDDSDDEMNDEDTGKKSSKNVMYDDFFDPPESGDENIEDGEEVSDQEYDQSDLEEGEDDDDMENAASNENEQECDTSGISKTPFEVEQDKIKKTISEFEERMIQKPEWHLTGEVAASNRPKDSLLHQDTDYDSSAKPVLVEDDDLLKKTEKAIISIIKNKAFSDGLRTVKPTNDAASLKKEIVLDQNKSKKSLAQVYEDDYLKKKYGEQEQENPKHVEIKKMMDSLLPELQSLFCHIPKPAIPDIKIVSNLPAITVEEVAPTSISDVTLLAPEEIKKKTGTIKGQTERSDSDRKRERRKKKMFQRMKFKKSETSQNPLSAKARKLDKMNTLKKLKQNRNTKLLEGGVEKIKSSKDFFSRLQDSVHSGTRPAQPKKKK